jgi:hypothetical protein
MDLIELWDSGHRIVVDSIRNAIQGTLPSKEDYRNLDWIALELRKQLRLIEAEVPGLSADDWKPWRAGPLLTIDCSWDLESACSLYQKAGKNCVATIELSSIMQWEVEVRNWFQSIAHLLSRPNGSEGPVAPDTWKHGGKTIQNEKMPKKAFLLVNFLWSQPERTAYVSDLAEPVFGDPETLVGIENIRFHARDANNFFRRCRLNWSISTSVKSYPRATLVNRPPRD